MLDHYDLRAQGVTSSFPMYIHRALDVIYRVNKRVFFLWQPSNTLKITSQLLQAEPPDPPRVRGVLEAVWTGVGRQYWSANVAYGLTQGRGGGRGRQGGVVKRKSLLAHTIACTAGLVTRLEVSASWEWSGPAHGASSSRSKSPMAMQTRLRSRVRE